MTKPSFLFLSKLIFTLPLFFFITGCDGNGDNGEGKVSFTITDLSGNISNQKKRDGEDYTSVTVSIIRVELVRDLGEDEDEIVTLVDYGASPLSLDLLNLENSAYQLVGDENIPAGTYTQIRLIVEAAAEHESQPVNPATFVLLEGDEEQRPVYVPSGSKTGLKINLNPNLELGSGQTFDISLDFNSRNSVHQTGNNDRFILRSTSMSANLTEVIVETPEEGSTEEEATE